MDCKKQVFSRLKNISNNKSIEKKKQNNGKKNTWFCGAWMKNGFHEDGLASAIDVVAKFSDKISVKIAAQ